MNATFIATIAGLATAICWGSSDYLSARSTKKLNPFQVNFGVQLSGLLIIGILFLFSGIHIHTISELVRIGLSSVLINLAFLTFVRALSGGVVGIIVPLGNVYPLFTIALSVIFLNAHFSFGQLSAMIIIVLGAILLAYEKNHAKVPLKELHRKTALAVLAAIIWGVAFFVVDPVVKDVSWQSITIVSELFSVVFSAGIVVFVGKQRAWHDIKVASRSKVALVAGLFGELGLMAFYLGSGHAGSVVIPAVLSAAGPLVASLWGAVFDKEKIGSLKRVGAVVTVAGIIILNLS